MTAKSRYWDHERCCWISYESAVVPSSSGVLPELVAESLPEQRADVEAPAAPAAPAAAPGS